MNKTRKEQGGRVTSGPGSRMSPAIASCTSPWWASRTVPCCPEAEGLPHLRDREPWEWCRGMSWGRDSGAMSADPKAAWVPLLRPLRSPRYGEAQGQRGSLLLWGCSSSVRWGPWGWCSLPRLALASVTLRPWLPCGWASSLPHSRPASVSAGSHAACP